MLDISLRFTKIEYIFISREKSHSVSRTRAFMCANKSFERRSGEFDDPEHIVGREDICARLPEDLYLGGWKFKNLLTSFCRQTLPTNIPPESGFIPTATLSRAAPFTLLGPPSTPPT